MTGPGPSRRRGCASRSPTTTTAPRRPAGRTRVRGRETAPPGPRPRRPAFERRSDEIRGRGSGRLAPGRSPRRNPFAARGLRALLERERPDVLHVHNPFPLLSPAVFHAARGLPVATIGRSTITARSAPPRPSCGTARPARSASTGAARARGAPRVLPGEPGRDAPARRHDRVLDRAGTLAREVDAFVVLTEFQREMVVRAGLPEGRVHVKPNFHPAPPPAVRWQDREPRVLFAGRLGPEKGVRVLLDAWSRWPDAPLLEIAGDGPERARWRRRPARTGSGPGTLPRPAIPRRGGAAHGRAPAALAAPSSASRGSRSSSGTRSRPASRWSPRGSGALERIVRTARPACCSRRGRGRPLSSGSPGPGPIRRASPPWGLRPGPSSRAPAPPTIRRAAASGHRGGPPSAAAAWRTSAHARRPDGPRGGDPSRAPGVGEDLPEEHGALSTFRRHMRRGSWASR